MPRLVSRCPIRSLPVLALCLLAGASVCVAQGAGADREGGDGEPQPLAIGDPIPAFDVTGQNRLPIASKHLVGKPLLLDLWATWCPPCRFTLPELQEIHESYGERGLRVVGISLDPGAGGGVRAHRFATGGGITYELYHDGRHEARRALAVHTVPVLFLFDGDGKLVRDWWGEPDFDEVHAALDALLGTDEEAAPAVEASEDSSPQAP